MNRCIDWWPQIQPHPRAWIPCAPRYHEMRNGKFLYCFSLVPITNCYWLSGLNNTNPTHAIEISICSDHRSLPWENEEKREKGKGLCSYKYIRVHVYMWGGGGRLREYIFVQGAVIYSSYILPLISIFKTTKVYTNNRLSYFGLPALDVIGENGLNVAFSEYSYCIIWHKYPI